MTEHHRPPMDPNTSEATHKQLDLASLRAKRSAEHSPT